MTKQEEIPTYEEWHEHPHLNGQYHRAVWVQGWTSSGTSDIEAPKGTPVTCAICGHARGELNAS